MIADGPTDALVNELHVVQVRIVLNGHRRDRAGRVALVGSRGACGDAFGKQQRRRAQREAAEDLSNQGAAQRAAPVMNIHRRT
jgi:hypothetical protein